MTHGPADEEEEEPRILFDMLYFKPQGQLQIIVGVKGRKLTRMLIKWCI